MKETDDVLGPRFWRIFSKAHEVGLAARVLNREQPIDGVAYGYRYLCCDPLKDGAFRFPIRRIDFALEDHRSWDYDSVFPQQVSRFLDQAVNLEMLGDLVSDPVAQLPRRTRLIGLPTEVGSNLALVIALGVTAGSARERHQWLDLQLLTPQVSEFKMAKYEPNRIITRTPTA
jgi:hypothetical protein